MPRPTVRVLALLELLQAGGIHSTAELSDKLAVDERTVRRYVDHLLDLDIPVEAVRGRYGGYRISPGYRMPPLMLSDEEALAMLLGLVAGRSAGVTSPSDEAIESAVAKLRRVLPRSLARQLDAVIAATTFTGAVRHPRRPAAPVLLTLAEATAARHPVEFSYTDSRDERTSRTIHPYGLVAHSGRWYVAGLDVARGELRTFRVDRVRHPRVLSSSFDTAEDFDAAAFVLAGLAAAPHSFDVSLLVQGGLDQIRSEFPEEIAILDELGSSPRLLKSAEDDSSLPWFRVRIQAEHLDWVTRAIAGLDRPFHIERPRELRVEVQHFADRLASRASRAGSGK